MSEVFEIARGGPKKSAGIARQFRGGCRPMPRHPQRLAYKPGRPDGKSWQKVESGNRLRYDFNDLLGSVRPPRLVRSVDLDSFARLAVTSLLDDRPPLE